jgi:hypothetical protein
VRDGQIGRMASYTHESHAQIIILSPCMHKKNQTDKKFRYWQWHDAAFLSFFLSAFQVKKSDEKNS